MPRLSLSHLRSTRVRAALALGAVVSIAATGSLAAWTDTVTVNGTTLTAGRIDLRVNNQDAITGYSGLNISNMVPGNSVAAVVTVSNNGTVPLTYTLDSVAVDGAPAGMGAQLAARLTGASSVTGTLPNQTCGGTVITGSGSSFNGALIPNPIARTLAVGASETLCIQATLSSTAPSTIQGASTTINFTFTGSSI